MVNPTPANIRNFGIISHIDAGKTTVSERILFYTGEIHKMGEVHDGSATMDWMEQEQERGITITATSTACRWKDWWFNLIDTPGHIDFTIEVERSLRVLDGAVTILSAVEGVQPQTESVWRQADRYRVPRVCFINKMDRIGADPERALTQLRERLAGRPVEVQIPVGIEGSFSGIVDLFNERALIFHEEDQGRTVEEMPVPETMLEAVKKARDRLVEAAADFDDAILADYLEGRAIDAERLRSAIRKGTVLCKIQPVLYGSGLRNKGIQPLLDAVGQFLPSPPETPPVPARHPENPETIVEIFSDPKGPLCAMAFKVLSDEGRKLTYLRIYSGSLNAGETVFNSTRNCSERVARLFLMHAHKRSRQDNAQAGDIVAATGLKEALTGDTLCRPDRPLILAGLTVPDPVVSLAVEPRHAGERDKLLHSLEKLQWEDPTFRVREDADTGQTVLTGMGELHLEVLLQRLLREFGLEVNTGRPQVMYRETLRRAVTRHELFHRETEGKDQGGEVELRLTPLPRGRGVEIVLPPAEEMTLPPELKTGLEESIRQACNGGVVAGYGLTDIEVRVLRAPFQPGFTTDLGIRAATQKGLLTAAREGSPTLLEPVMGLELITPAESAGKVLGSLQQKRGRVEGMQTRGDSETIRAKVPLSEMFGYMTELRSATKGRGTFSMEFSHFDLAPPEVLQRFGLS